MGKGKASTSSHKGASKGPKPSAKPAAPKSKGGKISDELRQAVKDLGGDEEDIALIAGVDNDDEADDVPASKGGAKTDEKSLKAALGDFMKGLDFAAAGAEQPDLDEEEEEEEESDEDEDEEDDDEEDDEEEDDEDEEEDEEAEDNDDEDEEEDEDDEENEEEEEVVPEKKAAPAKPTPAALLQPADPDPKSGNRVPAIPNWASLVPELAPPSKPLGKVQPHILNNLRQRSERLLENLPAPQRGGSAADAKFVSEILSAGTHQDKLSALVLLVRESPIHAVKEIEKLRAMAGWRDGAPGGGGGRDERMATVRALADWWVTGGGKEAGKLRYFGDQPLLAHPDITDRHLLVYAFEDFLKKWFFNILQIIEALTHDTLPYIRTKAMDIVFRLLAGNAEQEQNLLRLGVNKLGDNDRSVASKASHHILQLLQVHPAMKAVVAREVSAIVLKTQMTGAAGSANSGAHMRFDAEEKKPAATVEKGTANHGRYYGLITLNQMTLTSKDRDVAGRLVEVYFEVFRELLGEEQKKGEEAANVGDETLDQEQLEKTTGKVEKWRGRRKGAKPKGGHKAALEKEELVEAAEAKLVAAVLTGVNRALPFAKIDDDMFAKYLETLFKVCHTGTFNTSIQALQLIFQICQSRQAVTDRYYRTLYDSLFDPRLLVSSKQAMYLNLLFKSLKVDNSLPRVMSFVKRLLQMLGLHQPPFICGALYLLGELFETTPGLRRMLIEPEDDGEEHFVDAPEDGTAAKPKAESSTAAAVGNQYDGKKRDPLFAHADSSCLWELMPLVNHFHPSVSLQASQLLMGQPVTGSPDISLNTLISFLDKFVYRNPKKTLQAKGASVMQPAAALDRTGMVTRTRGPRTGEDGFVNSEAFWRKKVEDVPVDQLFFHKFFSTKLARKEVLGKKKGKAEDADEMDFSDDEEIDVDDDEEASEAASDAEEAEGADDDDSVSDPEEAEIWKAMKASMPKAGEDLGISDDSDEDDDDVDVDYSDDDEEEGGEDDDEDEEEDDDDEDEDDNDEEDEPVPSSKKGKGKAAESDSDSDDEPFPDFDEDDDDLIPEDEMDVVLGGSDDEPEEEDEDEAAGAKRKRREERKERRKKRKEMPVFGSYEDYAALIEADDDENL